MIKGIIMAIFNKGKTKCAISQRIIDEDDYFICFPPFNFEIGSKTALCYDACALREAFEAWEHRTDTVKVVNEYWVDYYYKSTAFDVLYKDSNLLIVRGIFEEKIRIMFLEHILLFDVSLIKWPEFILSLKGNYELQVFEPFPNTLFSLIRQEGLFQIHLSWKSLKHHDLIKLTYTEWSHFYSVIGSI